MEACPFTRPRSGCGGTQASEFYTRATSGRRFRRYVVSLVFRSRGAGVQGSAPELGRPSARRGLRDDDAGWRRSWVPSRDSRRGATGYPLALPLCKRTPARRRLPAARAPARPSPTPRSAAARVRLLPAPAPATSGPGPGAGAARGRWAARLEPASPGRRPRRLRAPERRGGPARKEGVVVEGPARRGLGPGPASLRGRRRAAPGAWRSRRRRPRGVARRAVLGARGPGRVGVRPRVAGAGPTRRGLHSPPGRSSRVLRPMSLPLPPA